MFKSNHHQSRFGVTLVLKNGRRINSCNYDLKTHPLMKKHYPYFVQSVHAEFSVLMKLNLHKEIKSILGSKIYVYREDKNGNVKRAKPCKYCMKILKEYGVRKVYYSTENGYNMEVI